MNSTGLVCLPWQPSESDILGLEPDERDPVAIILAAQLRLRSHRRETRRSPRPTTRRPIRSDAVRQIVSAREALLRRAISMCSSTRDGAYRTDRLVPSGSAR